MSSSKTRLTLPRLHKKGNAVARWPPTHIHPEVRNRLGTVSGTTPATLFGVKKWRNFKFPASRKLKLPRVHWILLESFMDPCTVHSNHYCLENTACRSSQASILPMSCNTSMWTKGNCSGPVRRCNGCRTTYCGYHFVAVQACRAVGGHVCTGCCDTSAVFVQNCSGGNALCPGCNHRYCEHHIAPASSAAQLVGGHICTNTAGNEYVQRFMTLAGAGPVSASDVNSYIRSATNLFG